ncbi:hypothetical protein CFU_0909 [Collimonas fungivorans Ter331]|uniref:Uncharacterized protein n=1 Tax=Collimonas fungivorans (strain Ter331) TaxID=1005048 RepID=G0AIF8_COLFT|nr:hypothetical protein CFU_0909 [Collimonas fungivorans Ter331]
MWKFANICRFFADPFLPACANPLEIADLIKPGLAQRTS